MTVMRRLVWRELHRTVTNLHGHSPGHRSEPEPQAVLCTIRAVMEASRTSTIIRAKLLPVDNAKILRNAAVLAVSVTPLGMTLVPRAPFAASDAATPATSGA